MDKSKLNNLFITTCSLNLPIKEFIGPPWCHGGTGLVSPVEPPEQPEKSHFNRRSINRGPHQNSGISTRLSILSDFIIILNCSFIPLFQSIMQSMRHLKTITITSQSQTQEWQSWTADGRESDENQVSKIVLKFQTGSPTGGTVPRVAKVWTVFNCSTFMKVANLFCRKECQHSSGNYQEQFPRMSSTGQPDSTIYLTFYMSKKKRMK